MASIMILVVWLIWSATRRNEPSGPGGSSAIDVLNERYARGEIERDEYLQRRTDLERR